MAQAQRVGRCTDDLDLIADTEQEGSAGPGNASWLAPSSSLKCSRGEGGLRGSMIHLNEMVVDADTSEHLVCVATHSFVS